MTNASERAGPFRALRVRGYRLLFIGQVLSVIGTWTQNIAIAWIVLRDTHSASSLGVVVALQFVPLLVLGAWAGTIADHTDKRRLLIAANIGAALVALATAVLVTNGQQSVEVLGGMSLLMGLTSAFEVPARQSFTADLVGLHDLPSAIGLNGATMTGSRMVGSAIGGLLIAALGASACLYVNAGSFLAVIIALAMIRSSEIRGVPVTPRQRGQLMEGLRYARRDPEVRFPLATMAVIGTLALNSVVLTPLLARITFDAGPELFAAFSAVSGLGAMLGALYAARRTHATVAAIGRAAVAGGVLLFALAAAPWAGLAVALLGASSFALALYISSTNARLQQVTDGAFRGRIMALYSVLFLGSTPIGSLIVSGASQASSPRVGVLIGAVATLGAGVVALAREHETRTRVTAPVPG